MCPRDCMALYGNVSAGERQKGDIFVFQRNMEQRLKRIDIRPHIALQNKYKNNTKQIQANDIWFQRNMEQRLKRNDITAQGGNCATQELILGHWYKQNTE